MAGTQPYNYEFFNVTFPAEYVAHVEINRPEKLNAWKEM
jgi:delta(3,5)-delta(2,4)-dienoyl-CoA isomerase